MKISVQIEGLGEVRQQLAGISERRLNAALATGLTRFVAEAKPALQHEIRDVFDRPTPFTQNSVFTKPATAANLSAEVGIKDDQAGVRPATRWLRWHVHGGPRREKAFERLLVLGGFMRAGDRAVPGQAARLDGFGNMSRGQLVQILSQLRLDAGGGSTRAMAKILPEDNAATRRAKANSMRRALGRAGGRYLALPNGTRTLPPGIYLNEGKDFGAKLGFGASRRLRPVLIFVDAANYEAGRFDPLFVVQRLAERRLGPLLDQAITTAIGRAAEARR